MYLSPLTFSEIQVATGDWMNDGSSYVPRSNGFNSAVAPSAFSGQVLKGSKGNNLKKGNSNSRLYVSATPAELVRRNVKRSWTISSKFERNIHALIRETSVITTRFSFLSDPSGTGGPQMQPRHHHHPQLHHHPPLPHHHKMGHPHGPHFNRPGPLPPHLSKDSSSSGNSSSAPEEHIPPPKIAPPVFVGVPPPAPPPPPATSPPPLPTASTRPSRAPNIGSSGGGSKHHYQHQAVEHQIMGPGVHHPGHHQPHHDVHQHHVRNVPVRSQSMSHADTSRFYMQQGGELEPRMGAIFCF